MNDFETTQAIQQVYFRYCEAIDSKEFERLEGVFTPDTKHDYSQAYGPGVMINSLAELLKRLHHRLGKGSNCGATHHNVGNFRIQVSGDRAKAKVNYYAVHRGAEEYLGALYSMWGLYDDELIHTPQGWRIAVRRYSISLTEGPVVTSRRGDPKP